MNITDDLVDVAPGDGVCEATAGVGDCSLRAAVMEANATPATSAVRVVLAANAQYVLTRVDDTCSFSETNEVSTDDLDINRSLTIIGNGARIRSQGGTVTHPEYGDVDCGFGIFENHRGRLDLMNLTLSATTFGQGAALFNRATAVLTNVSATGTATSGGVVIHNVGDLSLVRSTVFGGGTNSAFSSSPWAGVWSANGSLLLLNSHVYGNSSFGRYGSTNFAGVHVASGEAKIVQSIIESHRGLGNGGPAGPVIVHGNAVNANVPVQIIRSTVGSNAAGRDVVGGSLVEVSGSILGGCELAVTSLGHNSDDDGSCLGEGQATDLVASPTVVEGYGADQPWLPVSGSVVVDAIPAGTPGLCDSTWPTDYRGAPRPSGSGCDIGALERQPSDVPAAE